MFDILYFDEIFYTVHQDVAKVFLKIAGHLFADNRYKSGAKKTSNSRSTVQNMCVRCASGL